MYNISKITWISVAFIIFVWIFGAKAQGSSEPGLLLEMVDKIHFLRSDNQAKDSLSPKYER